MSILDISAAIIAIRQFNEDVETFAMDLLAYRHLGLAASQKVTIAEQVILLDRLWATQMFWKSGQVKRVIQSIEAGEGRILAVCGALRDHSLETSPAEVTAAAKRLLPIAMGHFGTDESERRYSPYSFATKYLHWTTRRHFPIMDSRARLAIFQLIQGKDDWPRIERESPGPEDYPLWIDFYSQLIRSLTAEDRENLLAIDYDTQPRDQRCESTLLRVLDKVFYWWGSTEPGADS